MGQENKKFEKPADVADLDSSRKENEIQVQKENIAVNNENALHHSKQECPVCGKVLQRSYLPMHMRIHTGERPYKCLGCGKDFNQVHNMITHMKNVHGTKKFFQCDLCQKVFKRKVHLNIHRSIHTAEKPHQCSLCDKHFRRKGSLNLHIQTMHSGREKKVRAPKPPRLPRQKATKECHICNKVFKKRAYLKLHMLVHTGEQPFECPQCHKRFCQKINMAKHRCLIHATAAEVQTNNISRNSSSECTICHKVCKTRSALGRHMKAHAEKQTHECTHCRKVFNSKAKLGLHLLVHTGEKPHQCLFCQKCFRLKQNLAAHVMKLHTAKGPNWKRSARLESGGGNNKECHICKKVLATSQNLRYHMMIHTGEKPHECLHCPMRFRLKCNLATHVMKMHMHTGQNWKPPTSRRDTSSRECQVCQKVFKFASLLKQHMLMHTDEKPYQCGHMRFRVKGNILRHERTVHRKEPSSKKLCKVKRSNRADNGRPFECNVCKKLFRRKDYLKVHRRVHSDLRPFSCKICSQTFKFPSSLPQHMKSVHKNDIPQLKPPVVIAKLFQRCGVVLERVSFIEDAVSDGSQSVKLSKFL